MSNAETRFVTWSNIFLLLIPIALAVKGWFFIAPLEVLGTTIAMIVSIVYHYCRDGNCPDELTFETSAYRDVQVALMLQNVLVGFLIRARVNGTSMEDNQKQANGYAYLMVPLTMAIVYGTGVNNDKVNAALWTVSVINTLVLLASFTNQINWIRKAENKDSVDKWESKSWFGGFYVYLWALGSFISLVLLIVYAILRLVREYDADRIAYYPWHGVEHLLVALAFFILILIQTHADDLRSLLEENRPYTDISRRKK